MKRLFAYLICLCAGTAAFAQQGSDSLRLKPVSLGIIAEGNASGSFTKVMEAPDMKNLPGAGIDLGGFIDYNMTAHLLMKFALTGTLESSIIRGDGGDTRMMQAGMDIPLYVMGRFGSKGLFYFGGGPYTHFTFKAWSPGDALFENPFRRVVGKDEISGEDKYALNDNHSGLGFIVGYEFPCGLQMNLSGKYSITNIINYDSPGGSSQHPYKLSFGLAWRFR